MKSFWSAESLHLYVNLSVLTLWQMFKFRTCFRCCTTLSIYFPICGFLLCHYFSHQPLINTVHFLFTWENTTTLGQLHLRGEICILLKKKVLQQELMTGIREPTTTECSLHFRLWETHTHTQTGGQDGTSYAKCGAKNFTPNKIRRPTPADDESQGCCFLHHLSAGKLDLLPVRSQMRVKITSVIT